MNCPFEPFYNENGLEISVYNMKALFIRLNATSEDQDTGFIELSLSRILNEKFRFSVVRTNSDRNNFELWIHLLDPNKYELIRGCDISRIENSKRIALTQTWFNDSILGVCQLPSDKSIHDFIIHFPNITFAVGNLKTRPSHNDSTQEAVTHNSKKSKEFNLCEVFSASYQDMIKDMNYDVYFAVDGKKIGSYKFALCASSDVFRATFKPHTKESKTGIISIEDFDYEIVKIFVDSLHTHKICFDDDLKTTIKIRMLANKYNVAAIKKAALDAFDVMDIDRNNFVDLYKLAAFDDEIMAKLVRRFVDMKLDTSKLLDFDQLDPKMQVHLLKSAHFELVDRKRKCEQQNEIHPSKVIKIEQKL